MNFLVQNYLKIQGVIFIFFFFPDQEPETSKYLFIHNGKSRELSKKTLTFEKLKSVNDFFFFDE